MRILAIADRPPRRSIRTILAETPVDVIVTLGDLEIHQIRELELITHIPKLGVYGNHCSGQYMEALGIQNMHMQTATVNGVTFGGIEGCVRYKETPWAKMYTQEEASEMLKTFPRVDIFLSHAPPYGVNDEPDDPSHAGFLGLRDYVLREKPQALLHGHTYPDEFTMVHELGSTKIVYVTEDKIVDL